ncbi:hypothetical protein [Streptomyces sp. NBC_00356]|uniref:hypothetical protein n=1 Tax=Streptomyces sp. NBC_00356 TaxID=2975724 RepID=UPI002E26D0D0
MPAYLIVFTDRGGDETRIEGDDLTAQFDPHWVTLFDGAGPCFAAPREKIHAVIRVDEQEPAPQKE